MANLLKNMRITEISLVRKPASPGADVILAKAKAENVPTQRVDDSGVIYDPIARTLSGSYEAFAKHGDEGHDMILANLIAKAEAGELTANDEEGYEMVLTDMLAKAERGELNAAHISAARRAGVIGDNLNNSEVIAALSSFVAALPGSQPVRKARPVDGRAVIAKAIETHQALGVQAGETLRQMAAEYQAAQAEGGRPVSFSKAYAAVTLTKEGRELYEALSGRTLAKITKAHEGTMHTSIQKQASDAIETRTQQIVLAKGLSRSQAFAQACRDLPEQYRAIRRLSVLSKSGMNSTTPSVAEAAARGKVSVVNDVNAFGGDDDAAIDAAQLAEYPDDGNVDHANAANASEDAAVLARTCDQLRAADPRMKQSQIVAKAYELHPDIYKRRSARR